MNGLRHLDSKTNIIISIEILVKLKNQVVNEFFEKKIRTFDDIVNLYPQITKSNYENNEEYYHDLDNYLQALSCGSVGYAHNNAPNISSLYLI